MFMFQRKRHYPSGPEGYRAYVVGDVHGRLDLLEALLGKIEADIAARPASEVVLVFVGDLIDRGPSSAGVVERLRGYQKDGVRTVFLLGLAAIIAVAVLVLGGDGDGDGDLVPISP